MHETLFDRSGNGMCTKEMNQSFDPKTTGYGASHPKDNRLGRLPSFFRAHWPTGYAGSLLLTQWL